MAIVCLTECLPEWATYKHAEGVGGQPAPLTGDKHNATACTEYCLRNRDCVGCEFTPGANTPCIYYTASQASGMNQRQNISGTTQYQLVDRCYSCA